MNSRKRRRKDLLSLCAEVQPDDGVDPRLYFSDRPPKDRSGRKTRSLCRQVEQVLRLSMPAGIDVLSVEPAPDATRVLVTVQVEPGASAGALAALHRAAPGLRVEVAAAVHRRRAPDLVFRAVEAGTPAGRAYLADHAWALEYASASRRAMADAVAGLLAELFGVECEEASRIDCRHNLVRRERRGDEDLWVHRKGALPAGDGERGVVPGSMGTATFHVAGRGCERSLASCSHGAGRAMSRTEARAKVRARDLARQMRGVWFDRRRSAALREEAPSAYKDVRAVMRAQCELVRIERQLRPILCYKGS